MKFCSSGEKADGKNSYRGGGSSPVVGWLDSYKASIRFSKFPFWTFENKTHLLNNDLNVD